MLCLYTFSIIVKLITIDGRIGDSNVKVPGQKFKGKNGYVPRGERYNNLLDTAYADIVEKRKVAPATSGMINNRKTERKHDTMTPGTDPTGPDASSKTPAVSQYNVIHFMFDILKRNIEVNML